MLILGGLLLFLGNMGALPIHSVWQLWPLAIVALGMSRWGKSEASRLWAGAVTTFGALFFCTTVGWIPLRYPGGLPAAILLITCGLLMLESRMRPAAAYAASADYINASTVFGGFIRPVHSQTFRGGRLSAILGSVELDLKYARPFDVSQPMVIEASCMFGAIKIRIPENWTVSISGTPIFGGFEDKTLPGARPDFVAGTLLIEGAALFGAIEVLN